MKNSSKIWKIVIGLAALAGIIYVVAAYGDKMVAWAKRLLGRAEFDCVYDDCEDCDCTCDDCECDCDMVEDTDFQN